MTHVLGWLSRTSDIFSGLCTAKGGIWEDLCFVQWSQLSVYVQVHVAAVRETPNIPDSGDTKGCSRLERNHS